MFVTCFLHVFQMHCSNIIIIGNVFLENNIPSHEWIFPSPWGLVAWTHSQGTADACGGRLPDSYIGRPQRMVTLHSLGMWYLILSHCLICNQQYHRCVCTLPIYPCPGTTSFNSVSMTLSSHTGAISGLGTRSYPDLHPWVDGPGWWPSTALSPEKCMMPRVVPAVP